MIDLDAIAERDRAGDVIAAGADRRALLEYITELEQIAEETLSDLAAIKDIVREIPRQARAERVAQASKKWRAANGQRNLTAPQWRMLEELSEPNKNTDNEWSFPHKALRTGGRLVALGLAKEHEGNVHRCVFSITAAGRARLAKRKELHDKLVQREAP